MEIEVTTAFPTVIGQLHVPDADEMNQALRKLILAEESRHPSIDRSNIGGWHSRPDVLHHSEPMVAILMTWMTWGVSRMVDAAAGPSVFGGAVSLSAWATICRRGAYHAPHSHSGSGWSGVYFVDAGNPCHERPLSGMLEFIDPRTGVEAGNGTSSIFGEPVRIRPQSGLLVVFPSWLFYWVHPYEGKTPRIAVSFRAALERQDCQKHKE